jgi:RNA ligase (TIGR02306 family)
MERKLASIQRIGKILPIEGADSIEIVTVNSWNVVSKKGEFKEGDLCVYFEIDSFLPMEKDFEFLRKSSYKKMGDLEGFRLKTIKLRGQVSQGLCLP